jgi:hypothetical protein
MRSQKSLVRTRIRVFAPYTPIPPAIHVASRGRARLLVFELRLVRFSALNDC